MSISYLSIHGVRNLEDVSLDLHDRYNFFIGPNGSGKTSLLEAIYLLGTARSFRTHLYRKVVHHDEQNLTVFGRIKDQETTVQMGVQKDKLGETQIKIDQLPCRQSAFLAQHLPLQLYYPDSFKIIDSSPKIRREILDWGVFHVKQDYFKVWAHYQRVLKQRNAWLRGVDESGATLKWSERQGICPWNVLLSDYAENVHQMREAYFQLFLPVFEEITKDFFEKPLKITYFKGWGHSTEHEKKDTHEKNDGHEKKAQLEKMPGHEDNSPSHLLLNYLERDKERDLRMGYTHHGPHKADILIHHDDRQVKDFFSRGQQKLVIIAIKLAQGILLSQMVNKECVYLLDDICAEFDTHNLNIVMKYLAKIPGQLFFTGISEDIFKAVPWFYEGKMFHVKLGCVE